MKKLTLAFLLSLACLCTAAGAVACNNGGSGNSDGSSSSTPGNSSSAPSGDATLTVDFVDGEGYSFVENVENGQYFKPGETVSFDLKVSAFYVGDYAIVYANDSPVAPNADGSYTLTLTESVVITVDGVQKDFSNMPGDGSFDNAYIVTKPIDLLYIAEQVNAGNQNFIRGSFVLGNDIDCGGEELEIIGDLSTENSYFSGCFTIPKPEEGQEMQRYTISNFVIDSDDSNYVGLFGAVYADASVQSSGLFYGICLDNFSVVASNNSQDDRTIVAGSLIGYGVGASVYLCDATNGDITVYGDNSYSSFAGGLVGYMQGFYMSGQENFFPAEVVYSVVDVDVTFLSGNYALYAGGITSYLASNSPYGAAAFIHNSYSTGNVSGALRSGGIAGGLGQYASIGNCYATGDVTAEARQSVNSPGLSDQQYAFAHAGGIVGYAENDSIVSDSFATGTVSAFSVTSNNYATGDIVGGGAARGTSTASSYPYVVNNCLGANDVDLSDKAFFTQNLSWYECDWTFEENEYPTIFYGTPEGVVTASLTLRYVAPGASETSVELDKQTSSEPMKFFDTSIQSNNMYTPIGNLFYNGYLSMYCKADNGYLSYGYFFDEACTQRVPYSYVPQKDVTLYVGFADPTPILGTYHMVYGNSTNTLTITFDEDGIATYSDGVTEQESYYLYDGETIIVEGARLARYFDGEIVVNENDETSVQDTNFDLNRYAYYDFVGKVEDGVLTLYDGVYFTKDAPLTSKKELFRGEYYIGDTTYKFYGETVTVEKDGATVEYGYVVSGDTITLDNEEVIDKADLKPFDAFKGTWTKSATVNKTYTFDGKGGWTYGSESGTYTVDGNTLTFTQGGVSYKASFNNDGALALKADNKTQLFYLADSYVGTWTSGELTVELFGIGGKGYGNAVVTYKVESDIGTNDYVYELIYEPSETDGYVALYYPHDEYVKDALFGYFTVSASNTLSATLYDPLDMTTGYRVTTLRIADDYMGEWISDAEEFQGLELEFDGNGGYLVITDPASGKETRVSYTLTFDFGGRFTYNGMTYNMVYDEDENVVIITRSDESEATLLRKDELAGIDFIDLEGVKYEFDGRSTLKDGKGTMTADGVEYTYTKVSDGEGWTVSGNGKEGTLLLTGTYYTLAFNGEAVKKLYVTNEFMGEWAVNGEYGLLDIGPTDLEGVIQAKYLGNNVQLTSVDVGILQFRYRDGNMPVTYYVYVMYDSALGGNVLVLSQSATLGEGEYTICTPTNELYGKWTNNEGFTLNFDGVTTGSWMRGQVTVSRVGSAYSTSYYYTMMENGTLMWLQEALANRYYYFKVEILDVNTADLTDPNVFVKYAADGKTPIAAIRRLEANFYGLTLTEATDGYDKNTTYLFDVDSVLGDVVKVNGKIVYTYELERTNDDLVYMLLTDIETQKTYSAVLDLSANNDETTSAIMLHIKDHGLYQVEATDANDEAKTYVFDVNNDLGYVIKVNGEVVYSYVIRSVEENVLSLHVTDLKGTTYAATLTLNADGGDEDETTPAITLSVESEPLDEE